MVRIDGTSSAQPSRAGAPRRAPDGSRFFVSDQAGAVSGGAAAEAASPVALDALLSLQAEDEDGDTRNRKARRQGAALLDGLRDMQVLILSASQGNPAAADALEALLADRPQAADSGLHAVVHAIRVRAEIELFRLGRRRPA